MIGTELRGVASDYRSDRRVTLEFTLQKMPHLSYDPSRPDAERRYTVKDHHRRKGVSRIHQTSDPQSGILNSCQIEKADRLVVSNNKFQRPPGLHHGLSRRAEQQVAIDRDAGLLQGSSAPAKPFRDRSPCPSGPAHPGHPTPAQFEHDAARALQRPAEIRVRQMFVNPGKAVPGGSRVDLSSAAQQRRADGIVQQMNQDRTGLLGQKTAGQTGPAEPEQDDTGFLRHVPGRTNSGSSSSRCRRCRAGSDRARDILPAAELSNPG